MSSLTVLIVDDEPLGRERVRTLLEGREEIGLMAEARDGREAIQKLSSQEFDLVFLDIHMPHVSGLDVVRRIGTQNMPPVVFVTAHDAHAVQAFEVHAVDYLLKPFEPDRFHAAFDRALELIRGKDRAALDKRVQDLLDSLEPETREPLRRLMIKSHQKVEFVRDEDIDWIEAAGNYVQVHEGSRTHLVRQTMAGLERRLDADRFMRIHRSTIVNMDRVKDLHPMFNGEFEVRLKDGTKLTMSRSYKGALGKFAP